MSSQRIEVNVVSTQKHVVRLDISRILVGVPASDNDTVVVSLDTGGRAPKLITLTYGEVSNLLAVATNGY